MYVDLTVSIIRNVRHVLDIGCVCGIFTELRIVYFDYQLTPIISPYEFWQTETFTNLFGLPKHYVLTSLIFWTRLQLKFFKYIPEVLIGYSKAPYYILDLVYIFMLNKH